MANEGNRCEMEYGVRCCLVNSSLQRCIVAKIGLHIT